MERLAVRDVSFSGNLLPFPFLFHDKLPPFPLGSGHPCQSSAVERCDVRLTLEPFTRPRKGVRVKM